MLGDGAIRSWWDKAWLRSADEPLEPINDPQFAEAVSDFSRRLGERAAEQSATDFGTAARERRAALRAQDRRHRHRQILVGGFGVGALMGLTLAMIAPQAAPPRLAQTASVATGGGEPMMAAAVPTPAPSVEASPAIDAPPPIVASPVEPAKPEPAASPEPAPAVAPVEAAAEPSPAATLLGATEVRELQNKLRGFGFNPGPSDGVAGPMTLAAATQYQQRRGLPETGLADRELLDQLRQDPSPQVVRQVAQRRTPVRASTAYARREPNPFERFGQWLDSLVR